MRKPWLWLVLLVTVLVAAGQPGASAAPPTVRPHAATTVCAVYCDTRDPSLAKSGDVPGRRTRPTTAGVIELHVSDTDGMAWASIDSGQADDSVWLDRSWDGGATWDGLLGKASIPSTWTGTRTLMYNLYDPANHRRAVLRACGDAAGRGLHRLGAPDRVHHARATGRTPPPAPATPSRCPPTTLSGRTIALHVDNSGMAWATIAGGAAGDEVWLDRSWDAGRELAGRLVAGPDQRADRRDRHPDRRVQHRRPARQALRRRGARLRPGRRPARTAAAPRGPGPPPRAPRRPPTR